MIHFALGKKKNILLIIGTALIAVLLIFLAYYHIVSAIPGLPFGGFVYSVTPCSCSGSFLLHVSPPVPGDYLYVPGLTTVYPWYQIPRSLVWLLGDFFPGGACWIWVSADPPYCAPIPAVGTINFVGTSF